MLTKSYVYHVQHIRPKYLIIQKLLKFRLDFVSRGKVHQSQQASAEHNWLYKM